MDIKVVDDMQHIIEKMERIISLISKHYDTVKHLI